MGRENIFDALMDKYNIRDGLKRIANLFNSPLFSPLFTGATDSEYTTITIEEVVDKFEFCNWKSRGAFLDCEDMRNTLGLVKNPEETDNVDTILYYLEYYVNICALAGRANCGYTYRRGKKFDMLIVDIEKLIDYLNHKLEPIESEDKILIIPKNPAGTAVAEISSPQTGIAILKYHHHSLKGDLFEKRKLLQTIANEYEEILKSKPCEPKAIFVNTNALLNNLYIRHKNNIAQFSDDELENWYDELYRMLLLCVLLNDNSVRMKKVDELLKSLKDSNV